MMTSQSQATARCGRRECPTCGLWRFFVQETCSTCQAEEDKKDPKKRIEAALKRHVERTAKQPPRNRKHPRSVCRGPKRKTNRNG